MAWVVAGSIKGPQGDPGADGADGADGATGATGAAGAQGIQGVQGVQGEAGVSLDIQGTVATYGDLPGSPAEGDAYVVAADGKLYFYDGTSWPADTEGVVFQGPQGVQGIQGIQGEAGNDGASGADGDDGADGADGARGSKWFTGAGSPSGVSGSLPGDMYLDTGTGDVYELS